jgi:hypothetical protein
VTFARGSRPNDSQGESQAGQRGDRNVVALLADMVMLPVTAFLYGMELLVQAMQGTQRVTQDGVEAMVGARPLRRSEVGEDRDLRRGGQSGPRATSGNGGSQEPGTAQKETATMDTGMSYESRRDRDLRDDTLKLVRYKILFVKRDYEVAFPEEEELVHDNMDGTSFAAWKVAEFIQRMHKDGVRPPARWQSRGYPVASDAATFGEFFQSDGRLTSLPEEDKKYLRVYYEVLERYPREKFRHEEQQIRVLEQIRDRINPNAPGGTGPAATAGTGGRGGGNPPAGGGRSAS